MKKDDTENSSKRLVGKGCMKKRSFLSKSKAIDSQRLFFLAIEVYSLNRTSGICPHLNILRCYMFGQKSEGLLSRKAAYAFAGTTS